MARDRLAAMRAAQGGYSQPAAAPTYGTSPPASSVGGYATPSSTIAPDYGRGAGGRAGGGAGVYEQVGSGKEKWGGESYEMQANERGLQDMGSFMAEISDLSDGIRAINSNIDQIRDLHSRALSQLDESQHAAITAQLSETTTETSRMTNVLKNRINSVQQSNANLPPGDETNTRTTQVRALKKRFMDTIQKYQSVEQESRQKYRAQMERQYKIVKPDATPEEIRQAVENDDQGQVFSQALLNSNRYGDVRAAYREVQERHEDIRKIEKTLTELVQMFNDLAAMVEEQDTLVANIENNAVHVETDINQAEAQMQKAVKSARAARRKRWICFWIIVAILIAVGIIVAVVIVTQKKN